MNQSTYVANVVGNEWSKEIEVAINETLHKLKTVPKFGKYLDTLDKITIERSILKEDANTLGVYRPHLKNIALFINGIESIPQAIYVFIHECSHHICEEYLGGLDRDYNSNRPNAAYFREEIRADSLAVALLKKYFNQNNLFQEIIKETLKRVAVMNKHLKSILSGLTSKFDAYGSWSYGIDWNKYSTWEISIDSDTPLSKLALAC